MQHYSSVISIRTYYAHVRTIHTIYTILLFFPAGVLCQHCGRKFNAITAERHIPKCANIINKPKAVGVGAAPRTAVSLVFFKYANNNVSAYFSMFLFLCTSPKLLVWCCPTNCCPTNYCGSFFYLNMLIIMIAHLGMCLFWFIYKPLWLLMLSHELLWVLHTHTQTYVRIYIYMHIFIHKCADIINKTKTVCVWSCPTNWCESCTHAHRHTQKHTHMYMFIYMCIFSFPNVLTLWYKYLYLYIIPMYIWYDCFVGLVWRFGVQFRNGNNKHEKKKCM